MLTKEQIQLLVFLRRDKRMMVKLKLWFRAPRPHTISLLLALMHNRDPGLSNRLARYKKTDEFDAVLDNPRALAAQLVRWAEEVLNYPGNRTARRWNSFKKRSLQWG